MSDTVVPSRHYETHTHRVDVDLVVNVAVVEELTRRLSELRDDLVELILVERTCSCEAECLHGENDARVESRMLVRGGYRRDEIVRIRV